MNRTRILATVERELVTVRRTPALLVTAAGFGVVLLALAWAGGSTGYVPVVLTLLTPLEVLVPTLAVAIGYRAIRADAQRGELELLRTYPITRGETVVGVYLGRAVVLLVALFVPLSLVATLVLVTGGAQSTVFPTHGGADSVLLFVRFVVLSALYGLVTLAAAIAVSSAARSLRGAIALGTGLIVVVAIGLDLALVAGLAAGVVPDGALQWLLAASPNSAYRGLVMQTVVAAVGASTFDAAPAAANLLGLSLWLAAGLGLARETLWRN